MGLSRIEQMDMELDACLKRIAELETERDSEKERRIHWQDLAYTAMNAIDEVMGTKTTESAFKNHCVLLPHHYRLSRKRLRNDLKDCINLVLLFYRAGPWSGADMQLWEQITGERVATTKAMCDHLRKLKATAEEVTP